MFSFNMIAILKPIFQGVAWSWIFQDPDDTHDQRSQVTGQCQTSRGLPIYLHYRVNTFSKGAFQKRGTYFAKLFTSFPAQMEGSVESRIS